MQNWLLHLFIAVIALSPSAIRTTESFSLPSSSPDQNFHRFNTMMQEDRQVVDNISEALFGLLGCVVESDGVTRDSVKEASVTINSALNNQQEESSDGHQSSSTTPITERELTEASTQLSIKLCQMAFSENKKSKKQTWRALQSAAGQLQSENSEGNALAIGLVYGALALLPMNSPYEGGAKAVASALSSTASRNKPLRQKGQSIANQVLKSFLIHSGLSQSINLNILTHFARAFKINQEHDAQYPQLAATAIQYSLNITSGSDLSEELYEVQKKKVSAALALASQIGPWGVVSPVTLVEAAIPYDFWHACQELINSSHKFTHPEETKDAVETLVNSAMDARLFRLADNMATKLYENGGKTRYVEARLYHAMDTISKVIAKRQLPIIERQVERVDHSVEKVKLDMQQRSEKFSSSDDSMKEDASSSWLLAGKEIRDFSLSRLSESGEVAAAHRLATLWEMNYIFDEEAMRQAAEAKRKLYMQWDEALPPGTAIPELISDPNILRNEFAILLKGSDHLFGIDCEWSDEDSTGACLFQLASLSYVLLLDIPALTSNQEGVQVLKETIGEMFQNADNKVVGFAPRQDLSRLRGSANSQQWLASTRAVIDSQLLVGKQNPKLERMGLSRVSNAYLGKPLDKAEQCSLWSSRPLSTNQRIYAALDAWVCCAIYKKLEQDHSTMETTRAS